MQGETGDWVLLKVARGNAEQLARKLQSKGIGAIVPKYTPPGQTSCSVNLFPGHILAEAGLYEKLGDTGPQSEWSVITNTSDRDFAIPGPIVNVLAGFLNSTMHQLRARLELLPPEYRIEQLMIECTWWRGEARELT